MERNNAFPFIVDFVDIYIYVAVNNIINVEGVHWNTIMRSL